MLGLYLRLGAERTRWFQIPKLRVAVGSDERNDLVLRDGGVEPFQWVLSYDVDRWYVHDPAGQHVRPIEDGAELSVGRYTLVVSRDPPPPPPPDPIEQQLLAAIAAGDETSRLVYADWLEGRGNAKRAEFVRLQQALAAIDPRDAAAHMGAWVEWRRLRELARELDPRWRRIVARPAVEGCRKVQVDSLCGMDWGTLAPTSSSDVRRCGACGDDVHYARTLEEARAHSQQGRCVAVDPTVDRTYRDLRRA